MSGTDQKGSLFSYPSIDAMWYHQTKIKTPNNDKKNIDKTQQDIKIVDPIGSIKNWYHRGNQFWNKSEVSYNGVMNGYGNLSQIDITGSINFLRSYIAEKISKGFKANRVLDCGSGIGRVAKQMLCSIFNTVDLIDQCQKYVQKSKQILRNERTGHFYSKGLQQFEFQEKYDCVWVQWVLSYLTDEDAIQFLKKAKKNLNQEGFIVVKDNYSIDGFLVDKSDCSVARSLQMYQKLFDKANLQIVKEQQQNWPKQLLNVKMYLLV